MNDMEELAYKMAFASVRGMTRTLADEIIGRFGSEKSFFTTSEQQLRPRVGSRSRIFSDEYRSTLLARCRDELPFIDRNRVHTVYHTAPDYPETLTQCDDAPLMIYGLGDRNLLASRRLIGIVGTRHATPYGADFTDRFIGELARLVPDAVIVSGMAYGIDVAAHRAALRAGLPTVAVLAHGLHTIYPAEHRSIAADMASGRGLLITEYRTCDSISKGNFVARNRIVAGMCHCLVVIESAREGGALITARLARDYGRDVFAVPGRVTDRYSEGCNRLIAANSASILTSAAALCEAMGWATSVDTASPALPMPVTINPDEEKIVEFLKANEDSNIRSISTGTGITVGRLSAMLVDMEFRNLILALPGAVYRSLL